MPKTGYGKKTTYARRSKNAAMKNYRKKKWLAANNYSWNSNRVKHLPTTTKQVVKKELKYKDQHVDYNIQPTISTVNTLFATPTLINNNIARNSTPNGRIGQNVFAKGVEIRLRCGQRTYDSVDNYQDDGGNWRIAIILDKQPNGAMPANLDQLLWMYQIGGDDNIGAVALRNLQYRKRFQIIHDQTFNLRGPYSLSGETTSPEHLFKIYKKLNATTVYTDDGATGAIGEIMTNAYYILVSPPMRYVPDLGKYPRYEVEGSIRFIYTD